MVVHRRERHFREHQLGTGLFKLRRSTRPVPIFRKAQGMTGNEMSFRRKLTTAYHLVDERNWASVERNGLMSANRLAVASGYDLSALRLHRPKGLVLPSGMRIRDQSPMPPAVLAKCLHGGLCPEDWYDLLNSKVFFWLEPERLNRQRKACGDVPQKVLVIDAASMLENHGKRAAVTPINTGNAMRAAAPRGRSTFVPWDRWLVTGWASEEVGRAAARSPNHRPVELAIEDAVEDIMDYVMEVITLGSGATLTENKRVVSER